MLPIQIFTPPGQTPTPRSTQLAQSTPVQQEAPDFRLSMAYKDIAYLEQRNLEMRSEAYAALQYQQREFEGAAGQYENQTRTTHMIELNQAENRIQNHFQEVLGIAKQAAQQEHQATRKVLMEQAEEMMYRQREALVVEGCAAVANVQSQTSAQASQHLAVASATVMDAQQQASNLHNEVLSAGNVILALRNE